MRGYDAYAHNRNYGCRIREFIYREHACVSLENELLRVMVVADKGTDILEFLHKPTDTDFMWQSYGGLRPPSHFRQSSPLAAGNFREHFAGGWYEMLPNGPAPCAHRGAEWGFHGEATLLPWDYRIETNTPERIEVEFRVRLVRLPLLVEKRITLESDSGTLRISERLTNEAGQDIEILWGHHPTFGAPFISEGARIYVPPCRVEVSDTPPANHRLAPNQSAPWSLMRGVTDEMIDLSVMPGADARSHDFARLEGFAEGWFAIVNEAREIGFALRWDAGVFPMMGLWQVARGATDYPYYEANYLLAIEPACDLPSLAEAARRGTAIELQPGVPFEIELEATAFQGVGEVKAVEAGGVVR